VITRVVMMMMMTTTMMMMIIIIIVVIIMLKMRHLVHLFFFAYPFLILCSLSPDSIIITLHIFLSFPSSLLLVAD